MHVCVLKSDLLISNHMKETREKCIISTQTHLTDLVQCGYYFSYFTGPQERKKSWWWWWDVMIDWHWRLDYYRLLACSFIFFKDKIKFWKFNINTQLLYTLFLQWVIKTNQTTTKVSSSSKKKNSLSSSFNSSSLSNYVFLMTIIMTLAVYI